MWYSHVTTTHGGGSCTTTTHRPTWWLHKAVRTRRARPKKSIQPEGDLCQNLFFFFCNVDTTYPSSSPALISLLAKKQILGKRRSWCSMNTLTGLIFGSHRWLMKRLTLPYFLASMQNVSVSCHKTRIQNKMIKFTKTKRACYQFWHPDKSINWRQRRRTTSLHHNRSKSYTRA